MTPTQISSHKTLSGLLVRRFEYDCGHLHDTALLIPPKGCPSCRDLRHARETEEAERRRVIASNRTIAAERAEKAHDYGQPHMVCSLCLDSIKATVNWFREGQASMFSRRELRGFKRVRE